MTWNEAFEAYWTARQAGDRKALQEAIQEARRLLVQAAKEDWLLLENALSDKERKWLAASIFSKAPVPKRLFRAMIRAAVYEVNPSLNRCFVEPCIASYGHRRVIDALLNYVETGNDFEKAGAVNALYWTGMRLSYPANTTNFAVENATPESRAAYAELHELRERQRCVFLQEFVSNENVHVRRSIIPSLKLDESQYPDDLKPLIAKAVAIARNHDDDYIRHRVEVQLGNEKLLYPLPHRSESE